MAFGASAFGSSAYGAGGLTLLLTSVVALETPSEAELRRLLGKDILFSNDLSVSSSGDWVLLEGIEALRASVLRRLITRPGEYKRRPDYGVGVASFVKRRRVAATLSELRQLIIDQLSLDPRIEEVPRVNISLITDGIKILVSVVASGETLTFRPFDFSERVLIGGLAPIVGLRIGDGS